MDQKKAAAPEMQKSPAAATAVASAAPSASASPQSRASTELKAQNVVTAAPGAWLVQAVAMAKVKDRDGASMTAALKLSAAPEPMPEYAESLFIGILGRCVIQGCDVHLLTADNEIAQHYPSGAPVPEGFEKAREYILKNNLAGGMALLVFNDHLEVLFPDGTTSVAESA